jgi:prepilin-type N-terminal cleavage/methylation domain-containing protein
MFSDSKRQVLESRTAFTLVEVMVAMSVIGIGIATTVTALTNLNSLASISRDYTGAYSAAMYQIDKILSDAPFHPNPKDPTYNIPAVLTLGSTLETNIPIYQDPNGGTVVSGTRTTTVTDVSTTYSSVPLTMYQATVKIDYTYRSRPYTFSMSTLRVADK